MKKFKPFEVTMQAVDENMHFLPEPRPQTCGKRCGILVKVFPLSNGKWSYYISKVGKFQKVYGEVDTFEEGKKIVEDIYQKWME